MKGSDSLLAIPSGAAARLLGAVSGEAKAVREGGRNIDSMAQGTRSYPFNLSLSKSEQLRYTSKASNYSVTITP